MEKNLTRLFDFQKFHGNKSLECVIDSVHARYAARKLDLEEIEYVIGAGSPESTSVKKPEKNWPFIDPDKN